VHVKDNPIVITEFDHRRLEGLLTLLRQRSDHDAPYLEELEEELERAEVVAPRQVPANVVTMNSEVLLSDLDSGEQLDVTLVFPGAAEAKSARISVLAPIGLALLGCRESEELSWQTPSRVRRLRVERVLYQPEAAGNYRL
jgi:regulator of nucleoside diphosphate kinase